MCIYIIEFGVAHWDYWDCSCKFMWSQWKYWDLFVNSDIKWFSMYKQNINCLTCYILFYSRVSIRDFFLFFLLLMSSWTIFFHAASYCYAAWPRISLQSFYFITNGWAIFFSCYSYHDVSSTHAITCIYVVEACDMHYLHWLLPRMMAKLDSTTLTHMHPRKLLQINCEITFPKMIKSIRVN